VVRDPGHRAVAAAAVDAEQERRAHLLRGRAEIEPAPPDLDAVARALVHGEVRPDGVRVLLDEPLQAVAGTDLLVGRGDEDQVAGPAPALARQRREGNRAGRHLTLHVEGAAPPDLAVDELA